MYVYIYIHVYIYIYICLHIYIHQYIYIYTHTRTHTHTHTHIYTYTYTHTHTSTNQLQIPILNPTSICMTMCQSQKCANSQISRQNRHVVALSCRFASCKRTLYSPQKSPTSLAKEPLPPLAAETYIFAQKSSTFTFLSVGIKRASPPQKRRKSRAKEPHPHKRDVSLAQKSPTFCSDGLKRAKHRVCLYSLEYQTSRLFAYEMNMTLYEGFLGVK